MTSRLLLRPVPETCGETVVTFGVVDVRVGDGVLEDAHRAGADRVAIDDDEARCPEGRHRTRPGGDEALPITRALLAPPVPPSMLMSRLS